MEFEGQAVSSDQLLDTLWLLYAILNFVTTEWNTKLQEN